MQFYICITVKRAGIPVLLKCFANNYTFQKESELRWDLSEIILIKMKQIMFDF